MKHPTTLGTIAVGVPRLSVSECCLFLPCDSKAEDWLLATALLAETVVFGLFVWRCHASYPWRLCRIEGRG